MRYAVSLVFFFATFQDDAFCAKNGRAANSTVVVDDTFADGNSQNQDLDNNSMWLFNGRASTIRTDKEGSVTFDVTPVGTSSEGFWAYFTKAGSPIILDVGDKLSVAVTFSLNGFANNGNDIRFGVFDSLASRNTTNLAGGHNDATFINDPGYAVDYFASGAGSPFVLGRRVVLSNANVFNNFGDFATVAGSGASERQPLLDNTLYTLTYSIERLTAATTRISVGVTGGTLSGLNYSGVESNAAPNTGFDYFAFRIAGTNFTQIITFTELLVNYFPALPVITGQPQPSSLTVQVGSKVSMTMGAAGSQLVYQWQRNGQLVTGNATAATPTLEIAKAQHADAGTYTAVVSNAGGSVISNPVTLNVSDSPVPPPPAIVTQLANATIVSGAAGGLSVIATGNQPLYQWFKNGVLLPGANSSQLRFTSAQVTDTGSYSVVVSNSSGSIASTPAFLQIVSAMSAFSLSPTIGVTGLCVDPPLKIQLDRAPFVGKSGKIVVYTARGTVVDTIDMAANPQTRITGGVPYVYYPVITDMDSAAIYLHKPLPYGDSYYITMEAGVLMDSAGAPFAGFNDPNKWNFITRPAPPLTRSAGPMESTAALTVAADGSGDFCTLQAAIDFIPAGNTQPVTITVKKGTYVETIYVPSSKPFLTIRGEDRDASRIQYFNNANLNNGNSRVMFGVDASDFTLENITLYNSTPKGGSQAEAFRGNSSRLLLNRVNLISFQDTLLLQGAAMVTNSYIEGDVDFMWGGGAVYFQNSELRAVTSGGYYTQVRNGQGQNGYVFVNCWLTAAPGTTGGVYLARIDPTVFPYSQVVYINSAMDKHIDPAGWLLNNSNSAPNVQFWEYRSVDLAGKPIDVSARLNASRQIAPAEADKWSDPSFVLGGWTPYTVNASALAAAGGSTVFADWSAAPGHSERDWVGLYQPGAADMNMLAWQYTGAATTGHLNFVLPARPGSYEFRYFLNDGFQRAAAAGQLVVQ